VPEVSAVRIRRARPEDDASIAELMEQLEAVAHGTVGPGLKARFTQILALDHHGLWVAETEEGVAGLVTASLRPTVYHSGPSVLIDELVVDARMRGRGVGRALVEAAVAWALDRGASEVEVSTEIGNEAAQAFYRRCGFRSEAMLLELELHEHSET
jgi:ribosomal protein S18 acetylase RimI-like enzyme